MKSPFPLLLLTDYRDAFLSTAASKNDHLTMNVPDIIQEFSKYGIQVEVRRYGDLNLAENYSGRTVIYTSSEDAGLRYKSFIEDVLLTLHQLGATILPRYELLRAHHNKTMMEGLRYSYFPDEAAALGTKIFGAFDDIKDASVIKGEFPKVIKAAEGAGSVSVALAANPAELLSKLRRLSRGAPPYKEVLREIGKRLLRKGWQPRSLRREKFIVQNMIPNLKGDFKVLVFGDRFYVLSRKNRPDDFRASGSGLFSYEIPAEVDLSALLDFSRKCFETIGAPTLSIDVAFDGTKFWTVEFQAVHFGTLTAEKSPHYHIRNAGTWKTVAEDCVIEAVYVEAIAKYIGHRHVSSAQ
jgi:hypothetical protein